MNQTPKQEKTSRIELSQPEVLEKPVETRISAGLTPKEPPHAQPQAPITTGVSASVAAADDIDPDARPWIEVLAPWNTGCETVEECTYDIPRKDGESGVGLVPARVRAFRAYPAPDGPDLGTVRWETAGLSIPNDGIPGGVNEWEVARSLEFPYDLSEQRREILIWVFNRTGAGRIHRVRYVTYRDYAEPKYEIIAPQNNAQVPIGKLIVRGWAEDRQSGVDVAKVEWSLDGGDYQAARPADVIRDPQNAYRVNWSFEIQNVSPGVHTIALRFRDQKGNQTARDAASVITITAAGAYKPENDLGSLRAYLDDLLKYAETRVETGDGQAVTKDQLTALFYQPFEQLTDIRDSLSVPLGNQPVNQLRAAIEVLRKYLATVRNEPPLSTTQRATHEEFGKDRGDKPTDAVPKSQMVIAPAPTSIFGQTRDSSLALFSVESVTEADFRLAAYQALLNRIGTSYDEIRLVRGAGDDVRRALASRLGIRIDHGINQLEQLYLSADKITEANLELLFGLADTTRDPLTNVAEPLLFGWRRDYLEDSWREQDNDEASTHETLIIDPDLINENDLLPTKGNPALAILLARTHALTDVFAALKLQRESQQDVLEGFDDIVYDTLGKHLDDLIQLDVEQRTGRDIGPELTKLHLTRQAFTHLLRVHKIAENGTASDAEWDDVYHILVQARKQQRYETWRQEETDQQITLTPRLFQISEIEPQLLPWRASWRARFNWLDTLQARIDQRQAMEDALRTAVSAAEEYALPLLRDALIADLAGRWGLSIPEVSDWLVHRLLVDLKTNASQRTTRLIQAIETIQGVLFALRAGQLVLSHPAASWKLAISEGDFDDEWQWMGSYSTWRAAIFVFFFPDSVLLPSLREPYDANQVFHPLHRTKHFEELLQELRKKPRLTPDQARIEASIYLNNILNDSAIGLNFTPEQKKIILTDQHTEETLGKLQKLCYDIANSYSNQSIPNYIQEIFYGAPLQLAWQLQKSGAYLAALDWFQTVYAYNLANKSDTPFDERKIYIVLRRETNEAPILSRPDNWLTNGLNPHALAALRTGSNPHTRYTLMSLSRCLMDFADSEFTRDTAESLARARGLYLTAQRVLLSPDLDTPTNIPTDATVLPNPLLDLLRLRVEIQLTKMRQGRNIAGMKRQVELPVSLPPGPSDLPVIGAGGQLIIPGVRPVLRPTPYYFRVLLERSKQLVNIAQQIEAAYLAALEKRDAENYNLLKANNDLQLALMGEELQNRRLNEAQAGVGLAHAQRQRAAVMSERYKMLSSIGLSALEQQMISSYQEAIGYLRQGGIASAEAARLGGQAASLNAAAAGASAFISAFGGSIPNVVAAALYARAGAASMGSAAAQAQAAIYSANAQVASTQAQIYGIQASAEWRQREFETQAAIAEQDVAIGEAQINVAQAHVGVADQERRIAQTQATQAQAIVDFLAKKFTNAELYEWMSGILGAVYSYFLQQATAMAQLAENQLAFERQDMPPKFIQADYWEIPSDIGSLTTPEQKTPDRKGLTGSARLLQDIYQLDQYAFETDKRKLNLSQTFSLARMAPYDFEVFRQTGVLPFATPMSFFDQGFPGHYLRLIKRVRVSVIALIPPHHGIRATLTATGISRVVTGGEVFQQVVVRRDPELVALSSPISATGVFEMDTQSEMLLPFESMGVDTLWEFQMPRAANPFDYRTIADVLVTIEYTALNSHEYRQQVLKTLDPKLSGERSYSFRNQFADAWYDLHNPEQSATPMAVKFKTWREDFPPNLDDLKIEQVLLFFSRVFDESAGDQPFEIEVGKFSFTPKRGNGVIGSSATTIDGVISTRRGNGAGWNGMIGKTPAGEWELMLPNSEEVTKRFKDEKIDDILLVITYGGRMPAWPN